MKHCVLIPFSGGKRRSPWPPLPDHLPGTLKLLSEQLGLHLDMDRLAKARLASYPIMVAQGLAADEAARCVKMLVESGVAANVEIDFPVRWLARIGPFENHRGRRIYSRLYQTIFPTICLLLAAVAPGWRLTYLALSFAGVFGMADEFGSWIVWFQEPLPVLTDPESLRERFRRYRAR